MKKLDENKASRRVVLQAGLALAVGAAGAATLAGNAKAQQKIAQKLVQYIPQTKKPAQQCSNCVNWVAPNACKIVEGEISPTGWCVSWAPAPKSAS
jgi:hypothetical protein